MGDIEITWKNLELSWLIFLSHYWCSQYESTGRGFKEYCEIKLIAGLRRVTECIHKRPNDPFIYGCLGPGA